MRYLYLVLRKARYYHSDVLRRLRHKTEDQLGMIEEQIGYFPKMVSDKFII